MIGPIGLAIRRLLAERKMTTLHLSEALDRSRSDIFKWITGRRVPPLSTRGELIRVFGCSENDLPADGWAQDRSPSRASGRKTLSDADVARRLQELRDQERQFEALRRSP
jgi:transcriptional regulator with XRE-family HTH domain